jgi:hypothetical protein
VEHNELDVYIGGVRLVGCIHVHGVAEGLVSVHDLLGAHQKPLVAAWDVVGPSVVFVARGDASPLDQYVPTAFVGAAHGHNLLYKCWIVDFRGGGRVEAPPAYPCGIPTKHARLEQFGIEVNNIPKAGGRVGLILHEGLDYEDEPMV